MTRLHLGCGKTIRPGWVNVDLIPADGIDIVVDLDQPKPFELAEADTVDEFYAAHLIEHIWNPLPLLESMWHAAKPGAKATFRCPYGASNEADEDPTHVRRMFENSWAYFGQPAYHLADYGYRGDWHPVEVILRCRPDRVGSDDEATYELIGMERNIVAEMQATLMAIKPARPQEIDREHTTLLKLQTEAFD